MVLENRVETIEKIILDRKTQAKTVFNPIADNISNLVEALSNLERQRITILQKSANTNDTTKLNKLQFIENYRSQLETQLHQLTNVLQRFDRDTLNIGVVGFTGQGKSTLLKTITGLEDDIFPTGSDEACTVARSIIQNSGATKAKVSFHSEESFLEEIIIPFYERLGFTPLPNNLEQWCNSPLPIFKVEEETDTTKRNIYKHLDSFYKRYAKVYYPKFKEKTIEIQIENIRQFASHIYDDKGNIENPECLAVKEINIAHKFKNQEVGSISLVDMPGLGTFRVGDERIMIQTLGNMVDSVLFLLKPTLDRINISGQETYLYDRIKQNLNNVNQRAFIVLNEDKRTGNSANCHKMRNIIKAENSHYDLPCVDILVADCIDYADVNSKILGPVLKHLAAEITTIDQEFIIKNIDTLKETISQLETNIERTTFSSPRSGEIGDFIDRLLLDEDSFITSLAKMLGELLFSLRERQMADQTEFKNKITDTIAKCREGKEAGLPTEDKVRSEIHLKGGPARMLAEYQDELRAYISKYFMDLDFDLQNYLETIKSEVVVGLKSIGLNDFGEERQGSEYLEGFLEFFSEEILDESSNLYRAFKRLANYNVSYAGILSHRVRHKILRQISPLNAIARLSDYDNAEIITQFKQVLKLAENEVFNFPTQLPTEIITQLTQLLQEIDLNDGEFGKSSMDFSEDAHKSQVQMILDHLSNAYDWAIDKCEEELSDICLLPNEIAYSMVEEFRDYVSRSESDIEEWKTFLTHNLETFLPPDDNEQLRVHWNNSVNLVKQQIQILLEENLSSFPLA